LISLSYKPNLSNCSDNFATFALIPVVAVFEAFIPSFAESIAISASFYPCLFFMAVTNTASPSAALAAPAFTCSRTAIAFFNSVFRVSAFAFAASTSA
jgi:hypothetical protein